MTVHVVLASPAHVGRIATRMRAADARECAAFGRTPKLSLRNGLRGSTLALTALVDGSPEAMIGVTPISAIEGRGAAWMLGTDVVMRHGRDLVAMASPIIAALHSFYARLENVVSVDNAPAIRLLRHWGFTVDAEVRTVGGVDFYPFWRNR